MVLDTASDTACSSCDLSCNECLASSLRLVVKENTVSAEHSVCFSVLLHHPEAVLLSNSIRAERMERCLLVLRALLNLTVKLGCGCLVNLSLLLKAHDVNCLEDSQYADRVNFACIFSCFEAYANV